MQNKRPIIIAILLIVTMFAGVAMLAEILMVISGIALAVIVP